MAQMNGSGVSHTFEETNSSENVQTNKLEYKFYAASKNGESR